MITLTITEGSRVWGSAEIAALGIDLTVRCPQDAVIYALRGYEILSMAVGSDRIDVRLKPRNTASRFVVMPGDVDTDGDTDPFPRCEAPDAEDEVVVDDPDGVP